VIPVAPMAPAYKLLPGKSLRPRHPERGDRSHRGKWAPDIASRGLSVEGTLEYDAYQCDPPAAVSVTCSQVTDLNSWSSGSVLVLLHRGLKWARSRPLASFAKIGGSTPNHRNVAALMQALRGSPGLPVGVPLEAVARHLTQQGVIVPAALTDDQAVKIGADAVGNVPTDPAEIALCVRQGLERIAKEQG
jgi:hypothetical protein